MLSVFSLFRRLNIFPKMSRELAEQYLSVLLRNFGIGLIRLFEPVYIYKLVGEQIKWVALYYGATYLIRFFFIPLAGKISARYGFERSMTMSLPLQIAYFYILTLIGDHHQLIFVAPFLSALSSSIYWIAYHTNFAHYGDDQIRGKQYSGLSLINDIFAVVAPIVGGILLAIFNFQVLFVVAGVIILLSCVPMLSTKEKFAPSRFSYFRALKRIITSYKTYKHNYLLSYIGYGADVISGTFWAIFIAIMLKNDFSLMGFLSGAVALLIATYSVYIGSAYDKRNFNRNQSSYYTSLIIYIASWPLRVLAIGWWEILLMKIVVGLSGRSLEIGTIPAMYRRAGIYGNLKYIVFFSQSINLGRILLLAIIFFWDFSLGIGWQEIFILGGIWSILMGAMWRKKSRGIA
ncbi:MAG: MFS transporter [Patescibacteria group bacterium]|nr:MFS transporter [Patescibacteria group bacterium]